MERAEGMRAGQGESISELIDATRALADGDFSRNVNQKLCGEFGEIANNINNLRKKLKIVDPQVREAGASLPGASESIADINRQAERETHAILEAVEQLSENHSRLDSALGRIAAGSADAEIVAVREIVQENEELSTKIMTGLAFQDLMGQRINGVLETLTEVENRILELLVAFNLSVTTQDTEQAENSHSEHSKKITDIREADQEQRQDLVDDLLADFGF